MSKASQKDYIRSFSKLRAVKQKASKSPGFSLLGVIIAVFITAVGLIAILSLSNLALKGSSTSKMRLIASGLAQEGVEIVRDIRKANLEWDDWYDVVANGNYRLQYDSNALMSYSETPLKLDKTSGLYQYISGEASPFYRRITLTKISADEVKVEVEVKWRTKGQWHYLTTEDRLWNWK